MLLQFLFQCGCPISSNESRYPESVDVLVPACHNNKISLTPSGNFLFISTKDKNYTLDLRTGKTTYLPLPSSKSSHFTEMPFYFLTDTLIFHSYYGVDEYIFDVTTEEKYQVQKFSDSNVDNLIRNLHSAEKVFLFDGNMVVALMHNISSSFTVDTHRFLDYSFLQTQKESEDFLLVNQVFFTPLISYLEHPAEFRLGI